MRIRPSGVYLAGRVYFSGEADRPLDRVAQQLVDLLHSCCTRQYALLAKLTARRDVADELLQDLFVRILRTSGIVEAPNPEAYLFRAAINLAFDW